MFDEVTGDWCSDLNITWYDQDGGQMASKDFTPDSARYFCADQVEDYYKLAITFRKTNKPRRYLKLTGIYLRRDAGSWQRTADFLFGAGGGQPDFFRSVRLTR